MYVHDVLVNKYYTFKIFFYTFSLLFINFTTHLYNDFNYLKRIKFRGFRGFYTNPRKSNYPSSAKLNSRKIYKSFKNLEKKKKNPRN